jgi:hypothetical protein
MRAKELISEMPDNRHLEKIQAHLSRNGYTMLGSGMSAMVYSKDSSTVIKFIFPWDVTTLEYEQQAVLNFYNMCQKLNSPYLPRYISIDGQHHATFVLDGEEFFMIALEKLNKVLEGSYDEAIVWLISDFVGNQLSWDDFLADVEDPITWKHYEHNPSDEFIGDLLEYVSRNSHDIEAKWKPFFEVCEAVFWTGVRHGYAWDLHTENVMMRGDTPVITDPWQVI